MKTWCKWTAIALISISFSNGFHSEKARANPLVLAVPEVAIGSLEAMAAAAAVAASYGIISTSQNREFQQVIAGEVQSIKNATAEAIDETVKGAVFLYRKVMGQTQNRQCPENFEPAKSQNCSGGLDSCCGDFLSKFSNRINKGRGGIIFRKGKNKFDCCMEWDYMHGGLEIFDERGNHMGEKGCDDPSDDPCEWTRSRGKHAEPASATHRPRSAACQP